MQLKITPGPWRAGNHPGDASGTGWREVLTDATAFSPSYVCQALEPDAQLIAAAPELLEACRALALMFVDGSHYETTNPYCRPQVKAALQAIAKATGFKGDWMDAVQ